MLKSKWFTRIVKSISIILAVLLLIMAANVFTQNVVAHAKGPFTPQYDRVELTEQSDYETIFCQTGLGKSAAEKLIDEGRFDEILEAQELFFANDKIECIPLNGLPVRNVLRMK